MPKMEKNRRSAREAAFLALFAADFNQQVLPAQAAEEAEEDALVLNLALAAELTSGEAQEYTKALVSGVMDKQSELDGIYEPLLSKSWKAERLSRVLRTLLRMAVYEMRFVPDMADETAVAINEAVELCKKYAEPKEAGFLNGVLGSVARQKQN